jgi:nitrate reductase gamma subunit
MADIYAFLTGPGLAVSLAVFFGGLIFRLVRYFYGLDWKLERVAYKPWLGQGMKGGLHSAFKWLIPYGTYGWRAQPFFTLCFILFHAGAVLVPFFLIGHNVILEENFGFSFPTLPQIVTDILTVCVIIGAAFITLRRVALAEVRILSTWYDYFILALATVPFITGFVARMHVGSYDFWLLCHIVSGELMLLLAPFTKLSHIALYFASRWQLGADYAIKRGGHRRGPCFPW